MNLLRLSTFCAASVFAAACGSDPKPPPAAPGGETTQPAATPEPAPMPPEKVGDEPSHSRIAISDEIKKACGITDAEAFFDYDSANVLPAADAVLTKLAQCFASGPLAGKKMRLVGHADPRGEAEYNMALGNRRADNVKGYLVTKGLKDEQGETTSRGEMDAVGTDEGTWAADRKVEIMLAN